MKKILRIYQNLRKGDEKNTKGYKRDRLKKAVLELSLGLELKILFTSEETENRLKMQGKIREKRFEWQKMPIFPIFELIFFELNRKGHEPSRNYFNSSYGSSQLGSDSSLVVNAGQ